MASNPLKTRFAYVRAVVAAVIALCCTASAALGAVTIEKVLPFATDRSVRVQVTVKSNEAAAVEMEARIVPVAGGEPLWEGPLATLETGANSGAGIERII